MTRIIVSEALFAPRDAARITGVSEDLQRDWRRHGYLPRAEGRARFDLMGLAGMHFMQGMAERGIGPKLTHKIAPSVALRIAHHAALWRNCWTGDVDAIAGDCWGETAARLNPFVPSCGASSRYLVWAANGRAGFLGSVDAFFDRSLSDDPKVAGPVIVLDLEAAATRLLDAAGAPMLTLAVEAE